MSNTIFRVLLPKYKLYPLDYLGPPSEEFKIGDFVKVPFRNKELVGVIWDKKSNQLPSLVPKNYSLKSINNKVALPSLSINFLKFIGWVGDYTISEYGTIFKLVMPKEGIIEPLKSESLYRLASKFDAKITKHRSKVIEFFINIKKHATMREIISHTSITSNALLNMKKLNILEKVGDIIDLSEDNENELQLSHIQEISLSSDQNNAVLKLNAYIETDSYKTILLDGATGSGKTEVYFEAIKKVLLENKGQVLLLMPEISLTTQLIIRFEKKFGFRPAVWHSEISNKEKKKYWHEVLSGKIKVLIGARSALFLPFKSLKLIIIDEEHETSYKQEDGVIYHARDIAVARGFFENINVLLVSGTPSIETLYNVQLSKYYCIKLPTRFGTAGFPNIQIIDLKKEKLSSKTYISNDLRKAIIENFQNKFQTILFLNRKGYSPFTICHQCGKAATCTQCSTWLNYHKSKNSLQCHYCGFSYSFTNDCHHCKATGSLYHYGPGVEKIEEEIRHFLPQARTIIITKDTVNTVSKSEEIFHLITEGKIDIIIGTQMIAKGHHFPKLTLVGVIDADLGLSSVDLRASEKTYQLLHQVSGRAGREKEKGNVLLQTYNPTNPVLLSLLNFNRDWFIEFEMANRKISNMPPFSKLAALIIYGTDETLVAEYATNLRKKALVNQDIQLPGPVAAPINKINNYYRYRILIKAARLVNIQKYIKNLIYLVVRPSQVKMKLDIDPYNFL